MLEILVVEISNAHVNYAVTDVSLVRYITPSEIGFTVNGRDRSFGFTHTERIEIQHKNDNPFRAKLMEEMAHA